MDQEARTQARQLWEQGQAAMRQGRADEAIRCYQQSLAVDPTMTRNYLSLGAAFLEKGEEARACPHLSRYLASNPDHLVVRAHYAELLLKLQRPKEARVEFERFAADAQQQGDAHRMQRIHCHSRLMEIAEAANDTYDEHLHRGIGLFLLAAERATVTEPDADLSTEGLLCRSAGELAQAHMQRPDAAQPSWYLYEVWSRLAQRQPALRSLREADAAAPFSYLTPTEKAHLELALRRFQSQSVLK
jgi:tetratricopeptide (TPR) repeat protein